MRCLWLTRIDPTPPVNGELIYSDRLIDAFAGTGAKIMVLCLSRPESPRRDGDIEGRIRWSIAPQTQRRRWQSVLSPLPNIAYRCAVSEMRRRVIDALSGDRWDTVFIDGLSMGWAAPLVHAAAARRGVRPRLVYVSHNHEESTRARVAANYRGNPLKRAALIADARKAARLERRVVEAADLVTAISPVDATLYAARRGRRPVIDLPPGYDGRRVPRRRITADMPRRAVIVGSFDWVAKQMNLRHFAQAAVEAFKHGGAHLTVVGDGGPFIDGMRHDFPSIQFTGRVASVYPYLDQARIAIVPERFGGGFKLKALDYVFNRLPIAALDRAFEGMPLVHEDSVLSYPDFGALVQGILSAIDDLELLNRLQERAYDACEGRFEWATRGRVLNEALCAL